MVTISLHCKKRSGYTCAVSRVQITDNLINSNRITYTLYRIYGGFALKPLMRLEQQTASPNWVGGLPAKTPA